MSIVQWMLFALLFGPPLLAAEPVRSPVSASISDLRFKDIRGLVRSLDDFGKKRAFVFVFTTTECPLVRKTIPKLSALEREWTPRGVQFVAVNVGPQDSLRMMAGQAIELDAVFPFVKDTNHSCVRALGVERTPTVVVLDDQRRLVYRGRVDDQLRLGGDRPEPTRADLERALADLLEGRPIEVAETPVDGCLITSPTTSVTGPVPTFHKDVAPILYARCVRCHRENGGAPFALLDYAAASSHAEMIAEVVTDERMPPWYAHPKFGKFQNDSSLTRQEREIIVNWVRSGRAEGDAAEASKPPEFDQTGWRIGKPDLVIKMLDEHTIPATGFVEYKHLALPYVFFNETWLEAVEIRPDNPAVVHHCNMAYVTTKGAGEETFITGYVPGGQPMDLSRFDNGLAFQIPKLAGLGLQIHYTTTGKPERCKISVGLRYPRRPVQKQLRHLLLDPHRIRIAPEHGAFPITSTKTLDRDISLLGMFSHMHVRGKDMTFYAQVPDQPRETLLQIPNYNFEWQLAYELAPGTKRLPKGTRVEAVAHYDNSAFNPYNPDSKRTVPYGQQTYDEMFNGYVFFVDEHEQLSLTVDPRTGAVDR
ncbi:MAG: redoxin family protein [Planctomycetaceae bacterium]|nr:redoxin family protein [Planctomycetaceae bacterium]